MGYAPSEALQCLACGRYFAQSNAFSIHARSCRPQRKRMASALEAAKETYRRKKMRTALNPPDQQQVSQPNPPVAMPTNEVGNSTNVSGHAETEGPLSLAERRPRRENRRRPLRYRFEPPEQLPGLPPPSVGEPLASASSIPVFSGSHQVRSQTTRQILKSTRNKFGLFRQYHAIDFPLHDPESKVQLSDVSHSASKRDQAVPASTAIFQPYPNQNAFLLGEWYWNGGLQKTKEDFKRLMGIICDQAFDPEDVRDVPWDSINGRLGQSNDSVDTWFDEPDAGWKETTITLSIPFPRNALNPGLQLYTFPPFRHRSIVSILKEKMANARDFPHFHLEPYELRWQQKDVPDAESIRVHGELYTSPAFLEANEEIQALAAEPGCSLPRVLVGLMFGSDSTHLTAFGDASLWPCYMYFGNESKYRRCKPNCNLCNHMAYFQKIPPEFKDFAALHFGGKGPSEAFTTHCQREYFHAQWKELLDDDFLEAYEHGVVIECCDGVKRRFYFRIFAYSADYPEKVLLSSIRNMATCPCPRCLIPKARAHLTGTKRDGKQRISLARVDDSRHQAKISSAREIIYQNKRPVSSVLVQRLLKPQSLVPTENAFSNRLSRFGFNLFSIFLVDFMHEVELGVWKKIFIHLLRILECIPGAIDKLNKRFRDMPTFGRDSIRRFTNSVSELKKLGARDYENLLQCSMPVFEDLLPEPHNANVLNILFALAHWHALAKLRQHTDPSLAVLELVTAELGALLRNFRDKTCAKYDTRELSREMAARMRQAMSKSATSKRTPNPGNGVDATLNLNTYKDHSLGDYVGSIRRYGTVDSYSTEAMELEHRSPKSRYRRTSRKHFERQLGNIERRQARIRRIRQKMNDSGEIQDALTHEKGPDSSTSNYHIGNTQNHPVDLGAIGRRADDDFAAKDFAKKLKEHLLPRVLKRLKIKENTLGPNAASAVQLAQNWVVIKSDRIFQHKLARFYYTTYDVRRSEDVINPRTAHCDIMLLADLEPNDASRTDAAATHPFIYGRVIGIYHINVVYVGPGMENYDAMRFDFLHVRWFQLDIPDARGGHSSDWASLRLNSLYFPTMTGQHSFGFLDPSVVLRSCHLIPAYSLGKRHPDGTGFSGMSRDGNDWKSYYANRFADRDMAMRYHWGLGIGHTYSHKQNIPSQQYSAPLPGAEDPDAAEAASRGTADPTANDEHDDISRPRDDVPEPLDPDALDPDALDPDAFDPNALGPDAPSIEPEAQGRDCDSVEAETSDDSSDERHSDREDDYDERHSDRDDDCDEQYSDRDDELYDTYYSD
ncbi:hypothetical protein HYPSUDRAFT_130944 [Hypholoma sublateritium FD-334 SS-4]|uniref:C2H2-type domain-containing protein n=1 Tax=Hypholoma sublateritium (strain FD-334 SS-4) TaxID=945553 RepID=A0A0D2P8Z4_HYPSF|nr:hypothetical protein HYPSUDRAFT_130944 [Hypholoma sublateritium FD-334 SS-4]